VKGLGGYKWSAHKGGERRAAQPVQDGESETGEEGGGPKVRARSRGPDVCFGSSNKLAGGT
jgi:hypothetical protein